MQLTLEGLYNALKTLSVGDLNDNVGIATLDKIYPVGSIYMSVNETSPSELFGGTWEQIQDTFLLASGSTYSAGDTGGEAEHTLTTDEMPSHTHTQNAHSHSLTGKVPYNTTQSWSGDSGSAISGSGYKFVRTADSGTVGTLTATESQTATNNNTGGDGTHNNMPPYLSVYMWKRIA